MKNSIILIIHLFITACCSSQSKITFQERLSDYVKEKQFKKNDLPNLEYIKNGVTTNIFWYSLNEVMYLIFAKNNKIYFVMNCGFLPVGEDEVGAVNLILNDNYIFYDKLNFSYAYNCVLDEYPSNKIVPSETYDMLIEYKPFESEFVIDSTFIPIEINLEVPVIILSVNQKIILAPLEE